jgi:non-ribosomal peptide synthetase component F
MAGQLAGAASALGVTAFTMLLAAYGGMLHRLTGRDDLVIGVPFTSRGYQGGDTVVGHCATMLPVRSCLRPVASGRDYLAAVQAALLAAYEHPEFSPSVLPGPDQAGANEDWGIFSAQLNLDRLSPLSMPGLALRACPLHKRYARAGLVFDLLLADGDLTLTAEFDAAVLDQAAVTAHADTFERLLGLLISDPDALLLDPVLEGA